MSSKKRPTMGSDPLDALIPMPVAAPEPRRIAAVPEPAPALEPAPPSPPAPPLVVSAPVPMAASPAPQPPELEAETVKGKTRATFHISKEVFEEARDAAVHLSGPPHRLTLAELAERGIRAEIERLKKEHNGGKPFPKRQSNSKGGRPIGS
jgi:hypothetical protein